MLGLLRTGLRRWNRFEELFLSYLFLAMTLVTFSQVVARYVFNAGAVWALELTKFLFAWLILFGMSYGVRKSLHLGIDAVIKAVPRRLRRILLYLSLALCLLYVGLLLKGAWDYWSIMFARNIGTEDLYVPRLFVELFSEAPYKPVKIPRWVPYIILPAGLFLLLLRFLEAGLEIILGRRALLIASHEVENQLPANPGPANPVKGAP